MTTCVLFQPQLEPPRKGAQPRWNKAREPLAFPGGIHNDKASKIQYIAIENHTLLPGVNKFPDDVWARAIAHPPQKERIQELEACGALMTIVPDAEVQIDASTDFTDVVTALRVVNASFDLKWLEFSLKKEARPKVLEAIKDRISLIEEQNRIVRAAEG